MKRVGIHSVPRSGSTWLGSIFDSHPHTIYKLQPLFSYALKDRVSATSTSLEIDNFFADLARTEDAFMDQKEAKDKGLIPRFRKKEPRAIVYKEVRYHHVIENLLDQDGTVKIIGLIRNPLSVISSWLKAPKEFRKDRGWKAEEEWRYAPSKNRKKPEEFNGYEKWKEVAGTFFNLKKKYPHRFYLLNYNDLLKQTEEEVKRLFNFCELDFTEQTAAFIELSTRTNHSDAYSVFKTKTTDTAWKEEIPQFIAEEIQKDPDFQKLNRIFNWI